MKIMQRVCFLLKQYYCGIYGNNLADTYKNRKTWVLVKLADTYKNRKTWVLVNNANSIYTEYANC